MAIPGNIFTANQESVETDITDWGAAPNVTVTRDNAHALEGSWSVKAVCGSGITAGNAIYWTNGGAHDPVVTAAHKYYMYFWIWTAVSGAKLRMVADWRNASNGFVGETAGDTFDCKVNDWTRIEMDQALAPATTTHFTFIISTAAGYTPANGDTFWGDEHFVIDRANGLPVGNAVGTGLAVPGMQGTGVGTLQDAHMVTLTARNRAACY